MDSPVISITSRHRPDTYGREFVIQHGFDTWVVSQNTAFVLAVAAQKHTVRAIKLMREINPGMGLAQAKWFIDFLRDANNAPPERNYQTDTTTMALARLES